MSARTPARRRLVIRVEDVRVGVLSERHPEDLAPAAAGRTAPAAFGLDG